MNTLGTSLLETYKNGDTFIETGTARGDGIEAALEAGFDHIISIEINPGVYADATKRFIDAPGVNIMLGDSAKVLKAIMPLLNRPVLFWLDAHWSTGEPELPTMDKCPLLRELQAIASHTIKDHVIMVDDMRYFRPGLPQWHDIQIPEIEEAVRAINPDYHIDYEVGLVPNDILVAHRPGV
jgi:hypothetical protein